MPTPFQSQVTEHRERALFFLRWLLITVPLGIAVGSIVAFFLWSLNAVTTWRWQTTTPNGLPWLLYFLPLAGILIAWIYTRFGAAVAAGNNLIIDEIHQPGGGVPLRMTPLVLIGTLLTHLCGGSAGREGTAVQIGGSIASAWAKTLRLTPHDTRLLLMAGIAAGFGAVFGTPLAGAVFAMEVLAVGWMNYEAIVPCLMASIVGDRVCAAWHIHHVPYEIFTLTRAPGLHETPPLDALLAAKVAFAAVAFGLASLLFAELTHGLGRLFSRIPSPLLRPVVGGVIVIALAFLVGRDYLGLGVIAPDNWPDVTIRSAFLPAGATPWSWAWKILFTAVTLGSGFKGGEVTPLFFIGATLGNTLALLLSAPVDLFAGLGFVAVFAGATNTPLACTLMAVELFGSGPAIYFALACFIAYLFSGHTGIYTAQRLMVKKGAKEGSWSRPGA